MDQHTRRDFLGRTLLAGAGATLLHSVPAGADSDVRPFDPAIDLDPGFVAGKVSEVSSGGTLSITDLDGRNREVRLDSGSRTWKAARYDQDPVEVGDCVFVRAGSDATDGVKRDSRGRPVVESLWANIVSLRAQIESVDSRGLSIAPEKLKGRKVAVIDRTRVEDAAGKESRGDAATIDRGDWIQLIAYADRADGSLTAATIISLMRDPDAPEPQTAGRRGKRKSAQTAGGFTVDRTGVASWFCCGGVNACGSTTCGGSGPGACASNWPCRSDLRAIAWPKLQTGCGPFCSDCCISSDFPRLQCGRLMEIRNPCIAAFQFGVRVRDCGPRVRCVGPQCNGYNVVAYDLTPCAYTAQGKDLASGVQGIQVCLSCP